MSNSPAKQMRNAQPAHFSSDEPRFRPRREELGPLGGRWVAEAKAGQQRESQQRSALLPRST